MRGNSFSKQGFVQLEKKYKVEYISNGYKYWNKLLTVAVSQLDPRKLITILNGKWLQRSKLAHVPFSIEAQPTNKCNFACNYCSYSSRRRDSKFSSWDLETGLRFADFCRKEPVRALYFSGGGEPLMWKHMPTVLKRLGKTPRLKKILITNGSLIGKAVSFELLEDFCLLLVSIASTKLGIYQKTMGGSATDAKVLEHVLNLPRFFKKSGPAINACVVVGRTNNQNLDEVAIDLVKRGFDFVYFKAAYDYEPSGEKLLSGPKEQIRRAEYQLPVSVSKKTNLLSFLKECREKESQYNYQREKCINLEQMLNVVVDVAGDICPCNVRAGNRDYSLGNIINSQSMRSLKKLYSSDQVLKAIDEEYRMKRCGRCRFKGYNKIVLKAEQTGKSVRENNDYRHLDFI